MTSKNLIYPGYHKLPSAIWQIFHELFIFYDYHGSSSNWNYCKIREMIRYAEIYDIQEPIYDPVKNLW